MAKPLDGYLIMKGLKNDTPYGVDIHIMEVCR